MTRRAQREHIFKLLFSKEFHEPSELHEQIEFYLDGDKTLEETDKEAIKARLENVLQRQGEVDSLLANAASGWRLERMGKAELAIMRLAVYEMRFDEGVPDKVAINEAVELAKKYGEESAPGFINGVLAKLVREEA